MKRDQKQHRAVAAKRREPIAQHHFAVATRAVDIRDFAASLLTLTKFGLRAAVDIWVSPYSISVADLFLVVADALVFFGPVLVRTTSHLFVSREDVAASYTPPLTYFQIRIFRQQLQPDLLKIDLTFFSAVHLMKSRYPTSLDALVADHAKHSTHLLSDRLQNDGDDFAPRPPHLPQILRFA